MQFAELAKILPVPAGATSFHTEGSKAVFLIGATATFAEHDLTPEQTEQLRAVGALGTFGQPIEA